MLHRFKSIRDPKPTTQKMEVRWWKIGKRKRVCFGAEKMPAPKAPMAEHIRNDSVFEIAKLLRQARERRRGDGALNGPDAETAPALVPTEEAVASYREALGMVDRLSRNAKPKQLFELHDLLKEFPHSDFGDEGGKAYESLRDALIEGYRRKVNVLTGWVSQ